MSRSASTESISALREFALNTSADIGLKFVRPKVAVDSLTQVAGRIVCRRRFWDALSKSEADIEVHGSLCRGMASPPYGVETCGRCPVFPVPLSLFIPAAYIDRSSNWVDWGVFWWTNVEWGKRSHGWWTGWTVIHTLPS